MDRFAVLLNALNPDPAEAARRAQAQVDAFARHTGPLPSGIVTHNGVTTGPMRSPNAPVLKAQDASPA